MEIVDAKAGVRRWWRWRMPVVLFLVSWATGAEVTVKVTGEALSVNGVSSVPEAVFGVHAGNFRNLNDSVALAWGIESSRMIQAGPTGRPAAVPGPVKHAITCWYDRFVPALNVEKPTTWKDEIESRVDLFARNIKDSVNKVYHIEFWNEPYLNWAYKPGVNTDPRFYEKSDAVEGGPVRLRGMVEPLPHLRWSQTLWYQDAGARPISNSGQYVQVANTWNAEMQAKKIPYPGIEGVLVEGETYNRGTDRQFTVFKTLRPVDVTQKSYYSASQNALHYIAMYGVFASRMRASGADVRLVGGWGFRPYVDDWSVWELLYRPLIDAHAPLLDGLDDHHYGGDTRMDQAAYETIQSYTIKRHGKLLRFYNTETGGELDPQTPEGASSPASGAASPLALRAFTYNVRDMLGMIDRSPDKAFSRAVHEPQNTVGGVEQAFRFLKPLRGSLCLTRSSDDRLWTVASKRRDSLAIFLFNDRDVAVTVALEATPPAGQRFEGARRVVPRLVDSLMTLEASDTPTASESYTIRMEMGPRTAWSIRFGLGGAETSGAPVTRVQYFADSILMRVAPQSHGKVNIDVTSQALEKAGSARLKYVLHSHDAGGGKVEFNGHPLSLEAGPGTQYAPIEKAWIGAHNELKVTAGATRSDLWMASVELEGYGLEPAQLTLPPDLGNTRGSFPIRRYFSAPGTLELVGEPGRAPRWISARLLDIRGRLLAADEGLGRAVLHIGSRGPQVGILRMEYGGERTQEALMLRN